ncbi:hypothetical protein QLX08_000850 [Tetragonisca angustula]|uniref:Uncharacterized protein n=1 Tax=Tetragonisca angustula TaxID=166442 RepID=A0AAW1ALA9_9HYME
MRKSVSGVANAKCSEYDRAEGESCLGQGGALRGSLKLAAAATATRDALEEVTFKCLERHPSRGSHLNMWSIIKAVR